MAETTKSVQVLKAFNGHNKDEAAEEKTRYFTRENEADVLDFLSEKEIEYRKENGFIAVNEMPVRTEATGFRAPMTAEEEAAKSAPTTTTRRRSAAASQE
jgi:hypothetical protein